MNRSAHALLPAVLLVGAAACSGTPQRREPSAPARTADITLPAEVVLSSSQVSPGATLSALLRREGVAAADVQQTIAAASRVFDVRTVRPAHAYRVRRAADGALRRFEYEIDGDHLLTITRRSPEAGNLEADVAPIAKTRELAVVRGRIDRASPSLFAAIDAAGESPELTVALAAIFSGEVDFAADLQPGDTFDLLVEKEYRDDGPEGRRFAGYGDIEAAELQNDGERLVAVRYTTDDGATDYFDERGVSLRRFFLRSPLKFEPVISSGFSRSRFHPILREFRPHLGIDYRAPAGAPVVAAADGIVVEAGMRGGAGRMVHLRHANGYESEYLHLSRIAVRAGARVRQGDVIGRVGATGLATGPHLDYRLKKDGRFINPLTVRKNTPRAEPLAAAQLAGFEVVRDRALDTLTSAATAAAAAGSSSPDARADTTHQQ